VFPRPVPRQLSCRRDRLRLLCPDRIGIGTFVSTLARSASQTQLIGFFVNPPLAMLSGR
jgi:hypothetical protein